EIKILAKELNNKNKKIKELEEKYIKLNVKYLALKNDHDTGDDHYTESRCWLERENDVLMRRNLEFFEESEATKTRNPLSSYPGLHRAIMVMKAVLAS
ncbi:14086_t:CDS:2, partial [Gigaspora rosea]